MGLYNFDTIEDYMDNMFKEINEKDKLSKIRTLDNFMDSLDAQARENQKDESVKDSKEEDNEEVKKRQEKMESVNNYYGYGRKKAPRVKYERSKYFNEAIKTVLDTKDKRTRDFILSINEANQGSLLQSLTSRLYDIITRKIDKIDYGDIPKSKGDVTQIPNYLEMCEVLDLISKIAKEYKQSDEPVQEINRAIANLKSRTDVFHKGYVGKIEFPMVMYCNICLDIVASTSLLVSTCIDFVKSPYDKSSFEIALDKTRMNKSKESMLFNCLQDFNKSCANGNFDKAMDAIINPGNKKRLEEGFISTATAGVIALVACVLCTAIPLLRMLVYYFYHARTSVADYFEIQAEFLQMNAMNLMDSSKDINDKDKIVEKQLSIVERFKKISNFFAIKNKKAEVGAMKEINNDNRKEKIDDIKDDLPKNINSVLF